MSEYLILDQDSFVKSHVWAHRLDEPRIDPMFTFRGGLKCLACGVSLE